MPFVYMLDSARLEELCEVGFWVGDKLAFASATHLPSLSSSWKFLAAFKNGPGISFCAPPDRDGPIRWPNTK
jgi:hypothetical protein